MIQPDAKTMSISTGAKIIPFIPSNKKPFPKLYLWCGFEDSLIEVNRSFDRLLDELSVAHVFESSEGDHSWHWWDEHIVDGFGYVFGKREA